MIGFSSPVADDFLEQYFYICKAISLCCFLNRHLHFCMHLNGKRMHIARIGVISRIGTFCIMTGFPFSLWLLPIFFVVCGT